MPLSHVSASQIGAYRLCARRWWYRHHRPDIKEPPDPALELGTAIHEAMEEYYATGSPKVVDHLVANDSVRRILADPDIPPRDGDIRIEYPRDYRLGIEAAGVPLKGRADLLWAVTPTHVRVVDWKSTSSLRWAKSAEDLERDTQLTIYARFVFDRLPAVTSVSYTHGQILTKKVGARVVTTRPLDRAHVDGIFPSIEATVAEMATTYEITDAADVPADASACNAFNRPCPYAEICPRSLYAGLTTTHAAPPTQGVASMTLAEKLKARAAATAPATTPAPAESTPPPATPVKEAETKAAKRAAKAAINPPDAAPVDYSKAGSYAATTDATPTPAAATQTSTASTARLVLELDGRRYTVALTPLEIA